MGVIMNLSFAEAPSAEKLEEKKHYPHLALFSDVYENTKKASILEKVVF